MSQGGWVEYFLLGIVGAFIGFGGVLIDNHFKSVYGSFLFGELSGQGPLRWISTAFGIILYFIGALRLKSRY